MIASSLFLSISRLKELRHDILSHFFDGLNYGYSVGNLNIMVCKGRKIPKG